jgi:predicted nucleic acid-binding protein
MEIVSDASVFLSIALDEGDRGWIIKKTSGYGIVAPEILPYEIGNALIAVKKRGRLSSSEIVQAFEISQKIPVKLEPVKILEALKMAVRFNIYAYDAYYLRCCLEKKLPLISLDQRMCEVAEELGIKVVD